MKDMSIYVHIPFCEKKCHYCAFNSFCANEKMREEYVNMLCDEMARRKVDNPIKTIYIGGGTPSILSNELLDQLVNAIYDNFNVYENAEFTIEANPSSITEDKIKKWKELRINRVSVGVQTLNDKSLKRIGRLHDKKLALESIKLVRKYFDNVSADLLIGLEDEKNVCRHARELLSIGIKHISCYLLEVYENTKLSEMIKAGQYMPLDDDKTIASFNKLANYIQDMGLERYEISNFCYPGYESQHNLNYWDRGEYLGFGLGAHSFCNNVRSKNAEKLDEYKVGIVECEYLTEKDIVEEVVMLGLRCKLGVNLLKLKNLGYDILANEYCEEYVKQGILLKNDDVLKLNPIYYHISNTIISNLLP